MPLGESIDAQLGALRQRADEDAGGDSGERDPGRHRLDLDELGIRVSLTRARYPNRPGGEDLYALTISRIDMRRGPDQVETDAVLAATFGTASHLAVERPGGPLIRMFRIPADQ